jgi:glutamine cyclotransferase
MRPNRYHLFARIHSRCLWHLLGITLFVLVASAAVEITASDSSALRTASGDSIVTSPADSTLATSPRRYTYRVKQTYPHDPGAFTQGLVYEDGFFFEGTGLYGRSSLRKVVPETGEVTRMHPLESRYFGEGITIFGNRIIQLTWVSRTGFVYDKERFERLRSFTYSTSGWGITHDGRRLIMSDGTPTLYFRDTETFEEVGRVEVRDDMGPVTRLNELEYVEGEVYANVWDTDLIARIDPESGRVVGWIDLTGLLAGRERLGADAALNGIAYDSYGKRLFVTGKRWPKLFEIETVPR